MDTSQIVTSFSSKSELSLSLSTDGKSLSFMGYVSPVNKLDVSNSNTPNHVDPTNPVKDTVTQQPLIYPRAVGQIDAAGHLQVTPVDAYSGNNGRSAIFATDVNGASGQNILYMVGNAGNGSGTEPANIVGNTGVQTTAPGGNPETVVIGKQQGTPGNKNGFQYGFSVTQTGAAADKSGKDDNFRGMTIFDNTLYVTKGSGVNGINTVYQVGSSGTLPTASDASTTSINILPGFPTGLASGNNPAHPFGLWFANADTLYVADEGSGKTQDIGTTANASAGLEKWSLIAGSWNLDYTLTSGLNLGNAFAVPGYTGPAPANDGLRSLTGRVNGDGTVTLYAITSTVGASVDQGADPNQLVAITDHLAYSTAAAATGESFSVLETARSGEVLRGVAFSPVPDLGSTLTLTFLSGISLLGFRRIPRHKV